MRLLVTGGCGFIGSNFIRYWLTQHPGDHILNLDALTYAGNTENLKDLPADRYTFIYGDICDADIVRRSMDGIDMVVHFAAESHVDHSIRNCQKFLMTNVMGTYTLLEETRRRGKQISHFHHISTDEVFGALELNDEKRFDENTPYDPKNPYSVSKASSDHLCRAFHHTYHVPVTISNCTNNYGPYQLPEKIVPRFIIQALMNQPLTIHGDGLQVRDWINVEDHVRGVESILREGKLGETFCFGGESERSILTIGQNILDILGKPHSLLKFVDDRVGNDRRYAMDWKKAERDLNWKPRETFEQGLRNTIEWYQKNEAWWRPLLEKGVLTSDTGPTTQRLASSASAPSSSTHTLTQSINLDQPAKIETPAPPTPPPSSMKIVLFGSKGFIGGRMADRWPNVITTDVRIDDAAGVRRVLDEHHPDAVVNAAGRRGNPNIDWCETHQLETFRANTIGPLVLAEACQERNIYFLHLSTGCIFFGDSPDPRGWRETDFANTNQVYGRSKYATDLLLSTLPNVGIVRLRMPIDHTPSKWNLIDKLANYTSVPNPENSASILEDLVDVVRQVVEKRGTGIFHATNPGLLRHHDLLALYEQYVDPTHTYQKVDEADLIKKGLVKVQRSNCIMQSSRLEELGIHMRPIDVALRETMQLYAKKRQALMPAQSPSQAPPMISQAYTGKTIQPFSTQKKQMRGVILAGGSAASVRGGSGTHTHLTPIFDRALIMYPLQTLLDAGITRIMVVCDTEQAGSIIRLLDSGEERKAHISYRIQKEPRGIAHALSLAEEFVDGHNCAVMLGDNIFEDSFRSSIEEFTSGATIFYTPSDNAKNYGVVEVDPWGNVRSIEERPAQPKSRLVQTGMYLYDSSVFDIIRNLPTSERGEFEIADVNNTYLAQGKLKAKPLTGHWWDGGTFQGMAQAIHHFSQKAGVV